MDRNAVAPIRILSRFDQPHILTFFLILLSTAITIQLFQGWTVGFINVESYGHYFKRIYFLAENILLRTSLDNYISS